MRKRVSQELGANYNSKLLPLWMTSQQNDGSTLGFTPNTTTSTAEINSSFVSLHSKQLMQH